MNTNWDRAADYATQLGYTPGSAEWWTALCNCLIILNRGN